jgi:hypothetical protein
MLIHRVFTLGNNHFYGLDLCHDTGVFDIGFVDEQDSGNIEVSATAQCIFD